MLTSDHRDASGAEKKEVRLCSWTACRDLGTDVNAGARHLDCYSQEEEEAQLVDVSDCEMTVFGTRS
jgi:hypothetical protein